MENTDLAPETREMEQKENAVLEVTVQNTEHTAVNNPESVKAKRKQRRVHYNLDNAASGPETSEMNPGGNTKPRHMAQNNWNSGNQYSPQNFRPNQYRNPIYNPQYIPNQYWQPNYNPQYTPNQFWQPNYNPQYTPNIYGPPTYNPQPRHMTYNHHYPKNPNFRPKQQGVLHNPYEKAAHGPEPGNTEPAEPGHMAQNSSHTERLPLREMKQVMDANAQLEARLREAELEIWMYKAQVPKQQNNAESEKLIKQLKEDLHKLRMEREDSEKTIKDLNDKVENSKLKLKSQVEAILKLKCELREARVDQSNTAITLYFAEKYTRHLNDQVDEASIIVQQHKEALTKRTKDTQTASTQTELEIPVTKEADSEWVKKQEKMEQLQQQLKTVQEDLKQQAAKQGKDKVTLSFEISELKDKLFTSEDLQEKTELKALNLEEDKKAKKSFTAPVEKHKIETDGVENNPQREEAEEMAAQQTEMKKDESETIMDDKLQQLEEKMKTITEKKTKKKKKNWFLRLFT